MCWSHDARVQTWEDTPGPNGGQGRVTAAHALRTMRQGGHGLRQETKGKRGAALGATPRTPKGLLQGRQVLGWDHTDA